MNNENQNTNIGVDVNSQNFNALSSFDLGLNNPINNGVVGNNVVTPSFQNQNTIVSNNNSSSNISNQSTYDNTVLYDTSNHINNSQVVQKQNKKATVKISYELKTAIILLLVLLAFIIIIPSIFDFFY